MAMSVALRTLIFTVCVPGGLTVAVPYYVISQDPAAALARSLGLRLAGATLILAGAGAYLVCAWDFTVAGKGTPAIWDPPRVFVTKGLYRYVRNPMYLGILAVLAGEAALLASTVLLAIAIVVGLGFHLFVLLYEEPKLRRTFGASYEEYCSRVRRWLPLRPRRY